MTALRVGVPAWTFVAGEAGGSETYASHLLEALVEDPDLEITTFLNPSARGVLPSGTEVVEESLPRDASVRSRLVLAGRGMRPQASTRQALATCDVLHYPFTVPVPRVPSRPWVMTLHDVQHLDLPQLFSPAERVYRRWAYDLPAGRASAIITVSDFCRDRIVARLRVDPRRVHVVPHGVLPGLRGGPGLERDAFVLYPARTWAHKNHRRLLEAMDLVRRARPDVRLVLTGGGKEALGRLPPWVEHRGLVPRSELNDLLARAGAMVFPSLYEGFGLPVLEALSHGCPVAASDLPPLREVADGLAEWFDPNDSSHIARAVVDALDTGASRAQEGIDRAAEFSWQTCAARHLTVYRATLPHE